jgi:hypothetical protein
MGYWEMLRALPTSWCSGTQCSLGWDLPLLDWEGAAQKNTGGTVEQWFTQALALSSKRNVMQKNRKKPYSFVRQNSRSSTKMSALVYFHCEAKWVSTEGTRISLAMATVSWSVCAEACSPHGHPQTRWHLFSWPVWIEVIVPIPHIRKLKHIRFENTNTGLIIDFTAALSCTGKKCIYQCTPSSHSYWHIRDVI